MSEKNRIRIKARRFWNIKPVERVKKSDKIYSRKSDAGRVSAELDGDSERRIVGIDFGQARTGISISDPLGLTAQPIGTVVASQTISELTKLVDRYEVVLFVIGDPLNMNGTRGESAKRVQDFAEELRETTGIPYVLVDERLSSVAGERALREMGRKPSRDRAALDQIAAVLILQTYLDRSNHMRHEDEDGDS